MAYATKDDAIALYGADYVTTSLDRDRDGVIGSSDEAIGETMFTYVDSEIDSFLAGRVSYDRDDPPLDIKLRAIDIWIYRLCTDPASASELKKTRFDAAMLWLAMVAKGQIKLTKDGETTGVTKSNAATVVTANEQLSELSSARRFSRDRVKGLL